MAPLPFEPATTGRRPFMRRDLVMIVIIVVIATLLMLPIFLTGFPSGADIRHHYRWSFYFYEALQEGSIYPRWLGGVNRGYGSPVMFYYAPLQFYVVSAFRFLVRDPLLAIAFSCWLGLALSGSTMYIFVSSLLSRRSALVASVVYMTSPFMFFDLYRVNALSELWTFVWIPLVLDAIRRIAQGEGWRAGAYLGVGYGLLLLTHVPIPFIITLMLPVYALVLTRDRRRLIQMLGGIVLGLGVSAVFLVSVLFETKHVRIDQALEQRYTQAFLFEDLDAITGIFGLADYPSIAGYTREANLVVLPIALLFVVAASIVWIERKFVDRLVLNASIALCVVASISLFMTTRLSKPLWDNIHRLQYLQSPVRWLVVVSCATSVLAAVAVTALTSTQKARRIMYLASLLIVFAFNLAVSAHVSTQERASREGLENKRAHQDVPEYLPLWWDGNFHKEFDDSSVLVARGAAEVSTLDDQGSKRSYQVSAPNEATLTFRSVYFPGWVARIDDKKVEIGRSDQGLIQVTVPAGEHNVALTFEQTWRHIKAGIISAASVLILVAILYFSNLASPRNGKVRQKKSTFPLARR